MRNVRVKYVRVAESADFIAMANGLLAAYRSEAFPIRMVFFSSPDNNDSFCLQRAQIYDVVRQKYGDRSPVVSYVAQKPLDGCSMVLEVHEIFLEKEDCLAYKQCNNFPYIVLTGKEGKSLFLGAVWGTDANDPVQKQSEEIFSQIQQILNQEQMPVNTIVRQWNYLERITGFEGDEQRYQAFNDARSLFYAQTEWPQGYPSATGIGSRRGGIQVSLQTYLPKEGEKLPVALDNRLQIAAHSYSQQVLLGETNSRLKTKTTPKFERAKLLFTPSGKLVYISGTAAIRGEASLVDADIRHQTLATLENIEHLISSDSQRLAGIQHPTTARITGCRVYVKHPEDWEDCKAVVSQRYPDLPVVYIEADICRTELLVEIEGIAFLND